MGPSTALKVDKFDLGQSLRQALAPVGLVDAPLETLGAVRDMAAGLIGEGIASTEALTSVCAHTGYGIYLAREEGLPTGVVALIMLNARGLAAVKDDSFDPLAPDLALVAGPNEAPAAVYSWGIAAATREAAKACVQGCWEMRAEAPFIPFFVRAATEAGRRLLTEKLRFVPYPGTTTGLLWWERADDLARRTA